VSGAGPDSRPADALNWEVTAAPAVELGERPVWDANTGCMIWVDIAAGQLHRLSAQTGDSVIATAGVPVGAAAPRAGGGYVLATADGFRLTDASGGWAGPAARPAGMPASVQFNDGACDPAGRFWAGTTATDGQTGTGSLYRLDPDGSVTEIFGGVTESNGLGWSPDGATFYYTDSGEPRSRVRAFDFDVANGLLAGERELISFEPADGLADGLVVDAEGCLWIAMWDGGCVRRYSPDGELLRLYPLPVSEPTCPGFGGPDLDELYVTTAWQELDGPGREAEPLAGHLLLTRPGAAGLPVTCYAG
jgi:sugar lactone lactonase YvrE